MSEKTNSLRHELRVQDPSADAASYLLESLADAAEQATGAVGVFAFASRNGVDMLLGETTLVRLLGRGVFGRQMLGKIEIDVNDPPVPFQGVAALAEPPDGQGIRSCVSGPVLL